MLFFSYWSLDEPLTRATVIPTLEMVLSHGMVDRVVLCTMERHASAGQDPQFHDTRIKHIPFRSLPFGPKVIGRSLDVLRTVPRMMRAARREHAGFIMARGVVAGGFAHFAAQRTGLPYAVDYFEPHADYMADTGVWRKGGILYRALRWSIARQLCTARFQVTVTHNYHDRLIAMGANADRLLVAPCPVDIERMRFDANARERTRSELGWEDAIIGIYVGKFGGLYHREAAYKAFAETQRRIGARYAQIILSSEPLDHVIDGLRNAGFDTRRVLVRYVQHAGVSAYSSASDFAFAPYKATPSSACISPMKIGEYWANGLPVLLTRGVGDDSGIVACEPFAGALFDPLGDDLFDALDRVMAMIARPGQRASTSLLAQRYRSMDITREVYQRVLSGVWSQPRISGTRP